MNIQVLTVDLVKGLNTISKALSSRNQLPVLANVLIQAQKGGLTLAATNLEIGIRTKIDSKVSEEGDITIPARSLMEFVSSITTPQLSLVSDNGKMKVDAGKFKGSFAGIDASEFPVLPTLTSTSSQSIDGKVLTQIADSVAYAAAVDESRPVLTGVRFHQSNGNLTVVATDGFRLSRKIIPTNISDLESLVLPAKTVQEAARLVGEDGKAQVKMEMVTRNNQVIFNIDSTDVVSRILEGNYPDTDKIIPTDLPVEVVVDRQEFLQGIKAAGIFAREDNNIVKFEVRSEKLDVKSRAAQQGESEISIEAENKGEGEIAFNYKFIVDALNSMTDERVRLQIKDHLSPGVIRPEKDSSLLALVMPVRI